MAISRSVTMPEDVMAEIDQTAEKLATSRSELLRRAWLHWRTHNTRQLGLPAADDGGQPLHIVINGVTYTQTEIEAA